MVKCVLCGNDIEDDCYCERVIDCRGCDYCRACREVLKIVDKRGMRRKKVRIKSSDYCLPGFKYSKDKSCFVREKDKK